MALFICFDLFWSVLICLRSYIFRGIQRWHWLCSCSFRTFCLDPHPGGTLPLSIRLLSIFLFSPTGPRCTLSPSKTLTAMAMATWQVWETVDTREDSRGVGGFDFHGGTSGLSSALEYFPTLGVDALWITPIFASPMADFGYDISDYRWGLKVCQNALFR